jgi:hypothetical protein
MIQYLLYHRALNFLYLLYPLCHSVNGISCTFCTLSTMITPETKMFKAELSIGHSTKFRVAGVERGKSMVDLLREWIDLGLPMGGEAGVELRKQLDECNKQLSAVSDELAAVPSVPSVPNGTEGTDAKLSGEQEGQALLISGLQRQVADLKKQLGERDMELKALRSKVAAVPVVKATGSADSSCIAHLEEELRKALTFKEGFEKQLEDNKALVVENERLRNGGVPPPLPPKYSPHDQTEEAIEWRKTQGRPQPAPVPVIPHDPDWVDPFAGPGPVMDMDTGKIEKAGE